MQGLVDIADPVPEVLERRELGRVIVGGSQDLQVRRDGREETLGCDRALPLGDRVDRAGHVDKVFLGPRGSTVPERQYAGSAFDTFLTLLTPLRTRESS